MPTTLAGFPFSQLKLPLGETIRWNASNPTFHRSWDYGLALTGEAFYLQDEVTHQMWCPTAVPIRDPMGYPHPSQSPH
jgi:hypothetical protein